MDKLNLLKLTKDSYRLTMMFPKREPLRCKIREVADDILAGLIMHKKNDSSGVDGQLEVIDSFFEVAREQNWVSLQAIDDIKIGYASLRSELADQAVAVEPAAELREKKPTEKHIAKENVIYAPAAPVPPLISRAASGAQPVIQDEVDRSATSEFRMAPEPVLKPVFPSESEEKDEDEGDVGNEELTEGQALRQNRIMEYLKEKGQAQVWEIQKIFPNISKRTIRRDFRSLLRQELIERVGERNRTYYKIKVNIA